MKEKIIEISKSLNFDLIGFCELKHDEVLKQILLKQEKLGYKTSFQTGNIEEKIELNKTFNMKSAIVVGISYQKNNYKINDNYCYLSSSSWSDDYHIVLKQKLEVIGKYLEDNNYIYKICVDNNILDERMLAYKAGLGYYGLNNLLINDKIGSYFFIGVILTDKNFEYDKQINKKCMMCKKCIESCPTKSLSENMLLNGNTCLSYLTQKKELTDEEKSKFNNCIYGCDICAQVCPHNQNIKSNNFKSSEKEFINIDEYRTLSNKEFEQIYKNNSCFWRGKKVFERNIEIYKQNKKKTNSP